MAEKFWIGPIPKTCDLCTTPITDEFIDGKTTMGPWGNMCPTCYGFHGVGLGLGRGQKYKKQADGKFLKVEG